MKPEAGQLTVNDLIAIGKAASFLRFEAAYKTHATDEARKEWRSVADALTDIECRCQPQSAEDPDEWVILDPVKYAGHVPRVGIDQFEGAGKDVCFTQENNHTAQKVGAFFESCGAYHRCRRRDLPKVETHQFYTEEPA